MGEPAADPTKVTNINVNVNDVKDKVTQVTQNLSEDDLKEVAIERLKWANRRRIAWVFSYATIAYGFFILGLIVATPKEISERVISATDLLTWVFMGFLAIPSLYFGGTVLEKFTGTNKK